MVYDSDNHYPRNEHRILFSDEEYDENLSETHSELPGSTGYDLIDPEAASALGYFDSARRSIRRRWTQRDMTNAFNAVKYQGMSLRGAAVSYNVPESTLRDRVHGRVSLDCSRPGPPTFFTCEEEKRMVDHILFMSKIGYPYTRTQVVELAGDMTKAVGRIAPFKYLNPSQAWFYAFLNRWPDLKNFLFGPRNNRKTRGVSGDSIQSYYELLDKVLTKYDIKDKPDHIWIMDELSVSCENQPPKIIPISIQRAQSTSYWTPSVSVLGCASAAGDKLPAFLFYRGDTITNNMMQGSVRGTKFTTTPSGWINSDSYILYFFNHLRQLISQRPILVLYDGHLQFISVRVLERARDNGILLFPLPPHPAYNHCIENTCFASFGYCFERRLERFLEQNMRQQLTKNNIGPIITAAYERALKPDRVISLFEKLGVCPYNNLSSSIGAYMSHPDDQDNELYENAEASTLDDSMSVNSNWCTSSIRHTSSGVHYQPQGQALYPAMVEHFTKKYGSVTDGTVRQLTASENLAKNRSINPNTQALSRRIQDYMGDRWANFQKSFNQGNNGVKNVMTTLQSMTAPQQTASKNNLSFNKAPSNRVPSLEVCQAKPAVTVSFEPEVILDSPEQNQSEEGDFSQQQEQQMVPEEEDIDAGDGPDFCGICGQLEPPDNSSGLAEDETQVVDWTSCDFCGRWVHLNSQCSQGSVISENDFMCRICNEQKQSESNKLIKRVCIETDLNNFQENIEEEIILD